MKFPGILLLLVLALGMGFPSGVLAKRLSAEETQDLYSQAKEFFRQGNTLENQNPQAARDLYQKALVRFEKIVQEGGIHNGKLFYNIGNVYFRMDQLGQAILNYRRALQYLPNDPNLLQNLDYARSRRQDKIEEPSQTKVLQTVLFWHYDVSTGTRFWIFSISFVGFWLYAALRLFFPNPLPRGFLVGVGGVSLLFSGSLLVSEWQETHFQEGVILSQEILARKGDGANYQPSFKEPLHAGTEFRLLEHRGDWYQIELYNGYQTWIPQNTAGLIW